MYNWIVKRPETAAAIHEAVSAGACNTPSQAADIAAKYGDEIFWTGTIPGNGAETIDATVADILREIGIPARVLGYQYVREAIKLTVGDMSLTHSMAKTLYPATAEKFNTTTCRVERAIRHAIEAAWDRGDVDTLQRYFGYTVSATKGRPTNGEFIAMVADHIVRQGRSDNITLYSGRQRQSQCAKGGKQHG